MVAAALQPWAAIISKVCSDVVAAVNFAREKNLRLVVKGGGHSYQGTSDSGDSLLIWTRKMNGIVLHELTPREPSLEDAFLRLTADHQEFLNKQRDARERQAQKAKARREAKKQAEKLIKPPGVRRIDYEL